MQDYLNTSNLKSAAVFRDVIIEADYNPLKYASQSLKIRTDDIKDPCQLDQWKARQEAALVCVSPRIAPQCRHQVRLRAHRRRFVLMQMGGSGVPGKLGKSVLPVVQWDKLDSTPYGRNMLPDGSYAIKPVNQKLAELQKSHIFMDHYNTPTGREVSSFSAKCLDYERNS